MFIAESIFHKSPHSGGGYTLDAPEGAHGDGHTAEPVEIVPLPVLLASADITAGQKVFKKCASCHTVEPGGANKAGPNLWDIVGRTLGASDGFSYSGVFNDKAGEGVAWSYENLNAFLTKPKEFTPGTKMSFGGLKKDADRANLLAYLQSLSDAPVAFPTE